MLSLSLVILSLTGQIGEPRGVRLLEDTPYLAQAPLPPLPPLPPSTGPGTDAEVSAQQLQIDIDALRRQRPSLGGGIALLASGGGVALLGGFYLLLGATSFGFGGVSSLLIIGVAGLVIGLPLAVIGVWLLVNRLEERKRIDDETARLRQELQRRGPQPRPHQYQPQPQLEIPPPQVRGPDSSLLLARF